MKSRTAEDLGTQGRGRHTRSSRCHWFPSQCVRPFPPLLRSGPPTPPCVVQGPEKDVRGVFLQGSRTGGSSGRPRPRGLLAHRPRRQPRPVLRGRPATRNEATLPRQERGCPPRPSVQGGSFCSYSVVFLGQTVSLSGVRPLRIGLVCTESRKGKRVGPTKTPESGVPV